MQAFCKRCYNLFKHFFLFYFLNFVSVFWFEENFEKKKYKNDAAIFSTGHKVYHTLKKQDFFSFGKNIKIYFHKFENLRLSENKKEILKNATHQKRKKMLKYIKYDRSCFWSFLL